MWFRFRAKPERALGIEQLDWYLSLFTAADPRVHRYIGEASPDSMWSVNAAGRIAEFCPEARIIILLRNPISYVASAHGEALKGRLGEQIRSLERALSLEPRRLRGEDVPCTVRYPYSVCYRAQGHFDEQVQRFMDHFERRQIRYELLDDIAADPIQAVDSVLSFLELPAGASGMRLDPRNVGQESAESELSARWSRKLREEFLPVVRRLEVQTGKELANRWGYA